MPISSWNQIIPVIDNEMDKSDQLACIRYKNQIVLAWGVSDVSKILEEPKIIKSHYVQ